MGPISLYPITLYLCHKPVIGLVMFVLFLCGAPSPFSNEPVDLTITGTTVRKSITIPVEMNYALALTFEFPSDEARLNDQIMGGYSRIDGSSLWEQPHQGLFCKRPWWL